MFFWAVLRFRCSALPSPRSTVPSAHFAGGVAALAYRPPARTHRSLYAGAEPMNRATLFRRHLRTIGLVTVLTISAMALPSSGTLAQGGVQIQILGQGVQATAGGG